MKELPSKIKRLRENRKDKDSSWTQSYVASKIGVARVTYTAYENGTKTPPPDIVAKIATLFDVSTDYLLGISDDFGNSENDEFGEFLKNVQRWYKEAPKDREEDLQRLIRIFEAFKND